jgi:hypothetical protein
LISKYYTTQKENQEQKDRMYEEKRTIKEKDIVLVQKSIQDKNDLIEFDSNLYEVLKRKNRKVVLRQMYGKKATIIRHIRYVTHFANSEQLKLLYPDIARHIGRFYDLKTLPSILGQRSKHVTQIPDASQVRFSSAPNPKPDHDSLAPSLSMSDSSFNSQLTSQHSAPPQRSLIVRPLPGPPNLIIPTVNRPNSSPLLVRRQPPRPARVGDRDRMSVASTSRQHSNSRYRNLQTRTLDRTPMLLPKPSDARSPQASAQASMRAPSAQPEQQSQTAATQRRNVVQQSLLKAKQIFSRNKKPKETRKPPVETLAPPLIRPQRQRRPPARYDDQNWTK